MSSIKTFTVRPSIEVNLTEKDIDDIMATALEGGVNAWCRKAEVVGKYLGEYASEQISRGGSLLLYDAESPKKWKLTLGNFLVGIKLYFEQGCHVSIEDNKIDPCDFDAGDADVIIQFALFGKQIFS